MGKVNFPAVDLVSENGQIYVQVSTVQDVSSKTKRTLQIIRNSCDESLINKLVGKGWKGIMNELHRD